MYSNNDEQLLRKSMVYLICLDMISKAISGIGSVNSFSDPVKLNNIVYNELTSAAEAKQKM